MIVVCRFFEALNSQFVVLLYALAFAVHDAQIVNCTDVVLYRRLLVSLVR
jgi:hypothetical protein